MAFKLYKKKIKKIDLPELLSWLHTIVFITNDFVKETETEIKTVNDLFESPETLNVKLNGVLTNLEHFINVNYPIFIDYSKQIIRSIKKVGNLN